MVVRSDNYIWANGGETSLSRIGHIKGVKIGKIGYDLSLSRSSSSTRTFAVGCLYPCPCSRDAELRRIAISLDCDFRFKAAYDARDVSTPEMGVRSDKRVSCSAD